MQGDPTYARLRANIFGTPTRLYPQVTEVLYLDRAPDALDEGTTELYADIGYTVRADGRVSNIKVLEKNVPNSEVRFLRAKLGNSRFRPRIVEGELLATKNLMIHQIFEVIDDDDLKDASSSSPDPQTENSTPADDELP